MAVYFVTGKLGGGKSLFTVWMIERYLRAGRKVATNLNLWLEEMLPASSEATVTRLPDKVRRCDLDSIGVGYDGEDHDENKFGALVLDECGTWLNSRNWNDKERAALLDWMLHARKRRWDVYFLVQDVDMIDKQLRASLCEHLVVCQRLDRIALGFAGSLVKMVTGKQPRLPKIHRATAYYKDNTTGPRADRWWYSGADLYQAYDTEQIFKEDVMFTDDGPVDMRAPYTYLSAWHLRGRYVEPSNALARLKRWALTPVLHVVRGAVLLAAALQGRSPCEVAARWGVLSEDARRRYLAERLGASA